MHCLRISTLELVKYYQILSLAISSNDVELPSLWVKNGGVGHLHMAPSSSGDLRY